jgi:DNA-binding NtrC family response regulator
MALETGGVARSRTVLVVDDEASVRFMVRSVLEKKGFRVVESYDGRHAWSLLTAGPLSCEGVDMVVTDLRMPGLDGLALTERLLAECPGIRIVLMSGYSEVEATNIESNGRWIFISKPFRAQGLISAIERVGIA